MRHALLSLVLALPAAAQSPTLLADVNTLAMAEPSSMPEHFAAVGSTVYFEAYIEATGAELYKIDLPSSPPTLVKDIYAGPLSSQIDEITPFGTTQVMFRATEDATGSELYVSDGTAIGTQMVKDINPGGADGRDGRRRALPRVHRAAVPLNRSAGRPSAAL